MQEENENLKDDVAVVPKEYQELLNNFDKIDTLTKRLVISLSSKTPDPAVKTQPSQELYYKASAKYFSEILSNPTKLIENQVKYYKSTLENWTNIQNEILKSAGFRICLVSPELHGRDEEVAKDYRKEMTHFKIDAVCTKLPNIWKN